jgi:hypothetical protein
MIRNTIAFTAAFLTGLVIAHTVVRTMQELVAMGVM